MSVFIPRLAAAFAALGLLVAAIQAQAAPFAYITESVGSNVRVIDTANNQTVALIHLGPGSSPSSVAVNPAGTLVYVTESTDSAVTVIDAAAHRIVARIGVAPSPYGIVVSPSGARVYVAHSGSQTTGGIVSVIDAGTEAVIATLSVGEGAAGLAISPDGRRLYVTNRGGNSISVIDTAANAVVATIPLATAPVGIAIDATGARLYVTLPRFDLIGGGTVIAIDTTSHAIIGSATVGLGPNGVAVNPAGTRVYVANGGNLASDDRTVSVIDTTTFAVIATVAVGSAPWGIAVHPSGARIYVTNPGADSVSVIDAATLVVTQTIAVGPRPISFGNFIGPDKGALATDNYQGVWWNAPAGSESGWGLHLAHQGDILFATWFTYDADGSGLWLSMSNGRKVRDDTYSGSLTRTTGPSFSATPWNASSVTATPVGSATFTFNDADSGTFTYTVNGVTQSKAITRYLFASPMSTCTAGGAPGASPNYQDLWWRSPPGSGSGWGVSIAHQGDALFAIWFTYGAGGRAQWLSMSSGARTGNATYSGELFRTTGPSFSASPWISGLVTYTRVGTASFTFSDPSNGTFSYTLDGISRTEPITRYLFASPATVCR